MLETDPYAPPASQVATPLSEAEIIRLRYLQREACAKGLSFVFVGIAIALVMAAALVSLSELPATPKISASDFWHVTASLALAALASRIAVGLRRLDRKMRRWLVPVAVILVPLVPFGTVVAGWLFHQLLCRKAEPLFSDDYSSVISQTGNIAARLSPINLIILALLLLSAGSGIFIYTLKLV